MCPESVGANIRTNALKGRRMNLFIRIAGSILCASTACLFETEAGVSGYISPEKNGGSRLDIGVEGRLTTGKSAWEISFVDMLPGVGVHEGRSKLVWDELDSFMTVLNAEFRIKPWLGISGSAGLGGIRGGHGRDTDYIRDPDSGADFILLESVSDTRGDATLLDLNLNFNLNEILSLDESSITWDVVIGYQYYEEELNDRAGVETVFLGEEIYEPFPGLDSTFDFKWQAARTGIRGAYPVNDRLSITGTAILLWAVRYRGEGFWNLRSDFISESPNFIQKGDGGTGAELKTSIVYDVTQNLFLEIGYWWISLRVRNGTDRIFFADGTEGKTHLDWARSYRHGAFAGLSGRF